VKTTTLLIPILALASLNASAQVDEKQDKPVIAVYDLDGIVSESGQLGQSLLDISDTSRPRTLLDLTRSMEKAAQDPAVKAAVLDVDGAGLDFAQIQEIRRRMLALREAGKDIWLYTEYLGNGTALLGSAANHFSLMPEASCSFHGIHAESLYFKGMLDKMGVRAEVIHIGDFKSFGENFYRTGPSEYSMEQEARLIDSIFGQLTSQIAEGRKLENDKVLALIDDGTLTAARAVEAGLADHLLYRTDFVSKLRDTYGKTAKFDHEYEMPSLNGPEITGVFDLFKLMFSDPNGGARKKDFVAVVAMDGDITDESVAPVRSEILGLLKDKHAKALVLRVNSPGGSAMASEVLWEALDEWKNSKKPCVVSMGGVAASGGYYISAGADRIFAEDGTITGSIGVVGMKFVVGDAMEKIGITSHSIQRGRNAGVMSMTRGFTDEEAALVRQSMTDVYTTFKKRITDGRGKALKNELEALAGGRVFSGREALKIGLVDEIGGLAEAVRHATEMAKLDKPEVLLLPEPKSMLDGLFSPETGRKDDEIVRAATPRTGNSLKLSLLDSSLLNSLPVSMRQNVRRLFSRMEHFREQRVLLLGPDLNLR